LDGPPFADKVFHQKTQFETGEINKTPLALKRLFLTEKFKTLGT